MTNVVVCLHKTSMNIEKFQTNYSDIRLHENILERLRLFDLGWGLLKVLVTSKKSSSMNNFPLKYVP